MSIVDLAGGVEDAVEPIVMDADEEYQLRVISCDVKMNKNDEPYMLPRYEVVDEPLAKEITRYFPLPFKGMDEKKLNSAKLQLSRFFEAFNYDPGAEFDSEDLIGLTGWAILGVETDDQYGDSNYIKRFISGK